MPLLTVRVGWSCKFPECSFQPCSEFLVHCGNLANQSAHCCPKRASQLIPVEAAHKRLLERIRHVSRETIHPPPLLCGQSVPQTCEGKYMVAHSADHVFRLPPTSTYYR